MIVLWLLLFISIPVLLYFRKELTGKIQSFWPKPSKKKGARISDSESEEKKDDKKKPVPAEKKILFLTGVLIIVTMLILPLTPTDRQRLFSNYWFIAGMIGLFGGLILVEIANRAKGIWWSAAGLGILFSLGAYGYTVFTAPSKGVPVDEPKTKSDPTLYTETAEEDPFIVVIPAKGNSTAFYVGTENWSIGRVKGYENIPSFVLTHGSGQSYVYDKTKGRQKFPSMKGNFKISSLSKNTGRIKIIFKVK